MHFQWKYAWLTVWHIISQQRCEIKQQFQRNTYRKLHIRSSMVTWPMMSHDPKRSRSWPPIAQYLNNCARCMISSKWPPIRNSILQVQWTHDRRHNVTPRGKGMTPKKCRDSISQQPSETGGCLKLTTNRKPHTTSPMATWPMTSRDPQRSWSWPQHTWSLISQKLCNTHCWFKL